MNSKNQMLSLVLSSYQSEHNLIPTTHAIMHKMVEEGIPYEIIIIDDHSSDKSYEVAKSLAQQYKQIRAYRFSRNYTSPYTQFAGFGLATGGCAVPIADDQQRPVESVVKMYRLWQAGAKVVIGYRNSRNDGFVSDMFSNIYYHLMNKFSLVRFPKGGADGFLADREVIDILTHQISHRNTSPIIEVLQLGFDPVYFPFDRPKPKGKSRWTFRKKLILALNNFFSASILPIRMVTFIGMIIFILAVVVSVLVIFAKLFSNNHLFGFPVPGWATLVLILMFFNGMIMLSIGIMAEYIWRIFEEVRKRPAYLIRKDENDDD